MSSEWRRGPIDPATVPEGADICGREGPGRRIMSTSGSESHLEHRCLDSQSGDWLDWLEPEPAWVAECRAALEPVLGVGEWSKSRRDFVYFGDWAVWTAAVDEAGVCCYVAPTREIGVRGVGFISWPHAAQFIRAVQLRSGAWRGE